MDESSSGIYTKIVRQFQRADGSPPDGPSALAVARALHNKLVADKRDFNHLEVYVRDKEGRDLVSRLLDDNEFLRREIEKLSPLMPKRWADFEDLARAKLGKGWRKEVTAKLGFDAKRLARFKELDSVPLAYFTAIAAYEASSAPQPVRLPGEARDLVRALWDGGVPVGEIAALIGDLLRGEVSERQVAAAIGEGPPPAAVAAEAAAEAAADQALTPGELTRMALDLHPGVAPPVAWRNFCGFVEDQCGVAPRELSQARKGRVGKLPAVRIREAYALGRKCLANPRYAAFAQRYGDVPKPRKMAKAMKPTLNLHRVAAAWFGKADTVACFALFAAISLKHAQAILRGSRWPSAEHLRFVEEVEARRSVAEERERGAATVVRMPGGRSVA